MGNRVIEFLRGRHDENSIEYFDSYAEVFDERMDVDALLAIREMEDTWIDLGHISDAEREKVPPYLLDRWNALYGPDEERRPHATTS